MPRLNFLPLPAEPAPSPREKARPFALEVRASAIEGRGVFAAEPIAARRKLGEIRGESITAHEARARAKGQPCIMIVAVSERRAVDASNSADPLRFANHSCRPNANLRVRQGRIELYALRDLAAGEEITLNYGETHHQGRLRCRCGAPSCQGQL